MVLCVDEKSQIQALDRSSPVLPLMPGVPERRTHDYVRYGTTNLYAALDVASGQVIAEMTPRHRAEEFRRFLNPIDAAVPARSRHARRARQLLHAQDPDDPALARAPPPLHVPFHSDLQLLAQPRRTLVRRTHDEVDQTRRPPLRPRLVASIRPGSPTGTTTPSPTSGTRPPTKSSTASPTTANESTTQVTSVEGCSRSPRQLGRAGSRRRSGRSTDCSSRSRMRRSGVTPGSVRAERSRGEPTGAAAGRARARDPGPVIYAGRGPSTG